MLPFGFKLEFRELSKAAKPQLENVLSLNVAELELLHQLGLSFLDFFGTSDDLDYFVYTDDGKQHSLDQMQSGLAFSETVFASSSDYDDAVSQVYAQ